MAGQEAAPPTHGGEADGPCVCRDAEQLRRCVREVFLPALEPDLRRMMREEMQNVLLCWKCPDLRIPGNQNQASVAGCFQLHFNNELPEIIFTGNIVESKSGTPVQIFITDADKRKITSGPLSTIKIEILVLDGDFDDERGSWAEEEFNKYVLRERKNRGPLLKGNCFITLKDGIGNLGSISFTDNSKWTRTQKFRLAARAVHNDPLEGRIQEAITEAFVVNDHRGEYTMKHHIPLLEDEVWRLKNIRKDGPYHRKLAHHGINTVQDFLKSLVMDQDKLCTILFGKMIKNKKWNTILQHAWKCDLGHSCYSYIVPEEHVELAFNCVFQVIAARFADCMWQPLAELPAPQQNLVNRLKHVAYANQDAMVEINDPVNTMSELPFALPTTYTPEPSDLRHTNVQLSHEAYGVDAPADFWDSSITACINDSNDAEGLQQPCLTMQNCKVDGVLNREACFAMNSYNVDGVFNQNPEAYGTESCRNMFMGKHMSRNHTTVHVSDSKWIKLLFTVKFLRSIRKRIWARRNAKIQKIKWVRLRVAFRFGTSIRKLADARRMESQINITGYEWDPLCFNDEWWNAHF